MIQNDNLSFEDFLSMQENTRNEKLKTTSGKKQSHYIRQHLAYVLTHTFDWDYWVTFTFGRHPDLEEVEDVLYNAHHRIDLRMLKHLKGQSYLTSEERSDWILFPELKGGRGLHYHGFIKLNIRPHIESYRDQRGEVSEWHWMRTAIQHVLSTLKDRVTTLQMYEDLGFRLYERTYRSEEVLKMIIYSMKEFCEEDGGRYGQTFDRFGHTIISRDHWKPSPIHQHRSKRRQKDIPLRPNKMRGFDLLERNNPDWNKSKEKDGKPVFIKPRPPLQGEKITEEERRKWDGGYDNAMEIAKREHKDAMKRWNDEQKKKQREVDRQLANDVRKREQEFMSELENYDPEYKRSRERYFNSDISSLDKEREEILDYFRKLGE